MPNQKNLQSTSNKRAIRREEKRLQEIFSEIDEKKKKTVAGLIERAAFMRVNLQEMEKDLDANGFTEYFQQSEKQDPYERERPIARTYSTMNGSYQKIMKQLTDLLPKTTAEEPKAGDEFEQF